MGGTNSGTSWGKASNEYRLFNIPGFFFIPTFDKRAEAEDATVEKDQVVLLTGRHRALLTALLFLELPFASPGHLRSHPASQLCQQVSQGLL